MDTDEFKFSNSSSVYLPCPMFFRHFNLKCPKYNIFFFLLSSLLPLDLPLPVFSTLQHHHQSWNPLKSFLREAMLDSLPSRTSPMFFLYLQHSQISLPFITSLGSYTVHAHSSEMLSYLYFLQAVSKLAFSS